MTFTEWMQRSSLFNLWSVSNGIGEVKAMLHAILEKEDQIMITAQTILNKVAEVKDRADAEAALLDEVHKMLVEAHASGDQGLMQQAIDRLDEIKQGAVDAITRNTDAAPVVPPVVPPVV